MQHRHWSEVRRLSVPLEEPLIDELEPGAALAIGQLWQGRATSELRVGAQFERLAREFRAQSASLELCARLEQAAVDEARHAELCGTMAGRYGVVTSTEHPGEAPPLVRFGDADERLSLLLHLVLLSCINEGVSTFYLRDAMKHSRAEIARATLRQLLSDDVQHARIGWTHLASPAVTGVDKKVLALALPTLLRLSRETWTTVPARSEPWFVEHGCPGLAVAQRAFADAVRELVLPGMAHVGVDVAPATRWLAAEEAATHD
jgi:hypothetical protein